MVAANQCLGPMRPHWEIHQPLGDVDWWQGTAFCKEVRPYRNEGNADPPNPNNHVMKTLFSPVPTGLLIKIMNEFWLIVLIRHFQCLYDQCHLFLWS